MVSSNELIITVIAAIAVILQAIGKGANNKVKQQEEIVKALSNLNTSIEMVKRDNAILLRSLEAEKLKRVNDNERLTFEINLLKRKNEVFRKMLIDIVNDKEVSKQYISSLLE